MSKKFKTVEEYLSTLPENAYDLLLTVRDLIKKSAPKAEELISYNIPAFKLHGRNLIYFAGWKEHISIYPIPVGNTSFQKEISSYQGGRVLSNFPSINHCPLTSSKK